jgi:hypothetical protein
MQEPVPGISAVPDDNNARYFHVIVAGPEGSPFEVCAAQSLYILRVLAPKKPVLRIRMHPLIMISWIRIKKGKNDPQK